MSAPAVDCLIAGESRFADNINGLLQTIADLGQMTLTGQAASGGSDTLIMSTGNEAYTTTGADSVVNLAQGWQDSEFNVVGDCCGSQANFTGAATIVVRTAVDYGSPAAPSCLAQGFTGETNNLSFGAVPAVSTVGSPAIVFTESSAGGAASACASAIAVGDTHLTTFDGLQYDFQASGDFVLAEVGSDFIVQTRQALAVTNPGWIQNATINKAVATQIGKTRVAIYIAPTRLVIDGQPYNLADGKTLLLASGVQVSRNGNAYAVRSPSGDSVGATLNSNNINTWIDVTVVLGHLPQTQARGLLGNPNGNANELATSTGTVFTMPISFTDLYHTYADSWRVQPNQALLDADTTIKPGIPDKPLYASDLDPQEAARVRAICIAAGVTAQALLDACVLDTAVLGDETAVRVFVRAVPPRAA